MLTGTRPFHAEYDQAIVYNILNAEPSSLKERRISEDVARIVFHCLEKEPENRYQTTADLFADLYRFRRTASGAPRPGVAGDTSAFVLRGSRFRFLNSSKRTR